MKTLAEAIAQPVVPIPAPTVTEQPANNPAPTERGQTGLVDAAFLKSLKPSELKELNAKIHDAIPRDERGKARALPEKAPVAEAAKVPPVTAEPVLAPVSSTETEPIAPAETEPPAPAPETAPATEPVATSPELEHEPVVPEKAPQRRVRGEKPEDDLALDIFQTRQRSGKPISMLEASLEANRILGIGEGEPEPAPAPKSVDVANQELAALREERRVAKVAFDAEAEDKAQTAIEDKLREITRLEKDEENRTVSRRQQVQTEAQRSMAKAVELYPCVVPDATGKVSAAGQRLLATKDRIWAEHKANNDPALTRADYPLVLLQMAAAEEKIAPKSAVTTAPTKPAPPRSVQPAKPAPPLASASARTTPNGTGAPTVATLLKNMNRRDLQKINDDLATLRGR